MADEGTYRFPTIEDDHDRTTESSVWSHDTLRSLVDVAQKTHGWAEALKLDEHIPTIVNFVVSHLDLQSIADASAQRGIGSGHADSIGRGAALVEQAALVDLYDPTRQQPTTFAERLAVLRDLAMAMYRLNSPSYARETQEFLATTEDLKYASAQSVWHYTNGQALLQILASGHIWASSPQNLNDASELTHGMEIIRDAFDSVTVGGGDDAEVAPRTSAAIADVMEKSFFETMINEIFYISASALNDSLTLWRNYASGDGYAIGIDPTRELSADGLNFENVVDAPTVPRISGWYKVNYGPIVKRKSAQEFVHNAVADIRNTADADLPDLVGELRRQVLILASTMKHEAFKDEREVRWITTNWMPSDTLHYEHGRRGIVPVMFVRSASSSGSPEPLPLRGVSCSPISLDGIVRTMQRLLQQRGYEEASKKVTRSTLPFKG